MKAGAGWPSPQPAHELLAPFAQALFLGSRGRQWRITGTCKHSVDGIRVERLLLFFGQEVLENAFPVLIIWVGLADTRSASDVSAAIGYQRKAQSGKGSDGQANSEGFASESIKCNMRQSREAPHNMTAKAANTYSTVKSSSLPLISPSALAAAEEAARVLRTSRSFSFFFCFRSARCSAGSEKGIECKW